MSSTTRPRSWAVRSIQLATLLLPPGSVRRRYQDELVSELWGMSTRRQLSHSLSIVLSAPSLHHALVEAGGLDVPHSILWCRLHLHHRWHAERTEDGTTYRRCLSCGTDEYPGHPNAQGEGMSLGNVGHWY
jgi:hypothetical protein